jgi:septal ring factor EnvC (AmiA/AmiB activator)
MLRTADRLAREISDIRESITALSKTLARIAGIERTVARMKGDLGAMQSTVASLKHEVESLREKPSAVVNINRENFEEFKVKHANLNVAVRSGPEPLLIPMEAFAQILLPYVKEEQQAAIDSLVRLKVEEMKSAGKGVESHAEPHPATRPPEEDPMAELQKLLDEGKSKPVWKVYLETYWLAAAGAGVFLGLVIVVMKLLRRKKSPSDDEEGILAIDEEMPAPMPGVAEEEEEQR